MISGFPSEIKKTLTIIAFLDQSHISSSQIKHTQQTQKSKLLKIIAAIKKIRKIKFLANVRVGKVVCGTSGRSRAFELRVDGKQRHLAQGIRRR